MRIKQVIIYITKLTIRHVPSTKIIKGGDFGIYINITNNSTTSE